MAGPERYRDSTQIVVPCEALDGHRAELRDQFVVTIFARDGVCRIIGSPVEIDDVQRYLTRHGVSVP